MGREKITKLAADLTFLLGDLLAREEQTPEALRTKIEQKTRVIAPVVLADMISKSPWEHLGNGKTFTSGVSVDENGVGSLVLPSDFLRLVALRMTDWERPVTEVSSSGSLQAMVEGCGVEGIGGNRECPQAIFGFDKTGNRTLRLFRCSDTSKVEVGRYMPVPTVDAEDCLEVPEMLYSELVLRLYDFLK